MKCLQTEPTNANGLLTPRSQPDALIDNDEAALAQIYEMVVNRRVMSVDGATVPLAG